VDSELSMLNPSTCAVRIQIIVIDGGKDLLQEPVYFAIDLAWWAVHGYAALVVRPAGKNSSKHSHRNEHSKAMSRILKITLKKGAVNSIQELLVQWAFLVDNLLERVVAGHSGGCRSKSMTAAVTPW
jgi:hypothetical protein